ncbi:MAG: hypothetical protein FIA90_06670 [candidate division NC10 bacterium]|nr:hypothetical protein [candidate division NC10 bacterium]
MKRFSIGSAVMAGFLGTLAMTALMYMAPLMGLPKMDLIGALGQALPIGLPPYLTGSLVHLFNGVVLAMIYAVAFATWLPGPRPLKGALYSILPWIFAMVALAPALTVLHSLLAGSAAVPAMNPCGAVVPMNPCGAVVATNPCAAVTPDGGTAPSAMLMAGMSLMAHLLYGAVIGAVYRAKDCVGSHSPESSPQVDDITCRLGNIR